VEGVAYPIAAADQCDSGEDNDQWGKNGEGSDEGAATQGGEVVRFCGVRLFFLGTAGEQGGLGWCWIVGIHALIQSLNGALRRSIDAAGRAVMLGWYRDAKKVGHAANLRKGGR